MTLVLIAICAIFYLPLIDQQHTSIEELVFGGYTIIRITASRWPDVAGLDCRSNRRSESVKAVDNYR